MNNEKVIYSINGEKTVGDRVDAILKNIYGKVDYCIYENVRHDLMILIGMEDED